MAFLRHINPIHCLQIPYHIFQTIQTIGSLADVYIVLGNNDRTAYIL